MAEKMYEDCLSVLFKSSAVIGDTDTTRCVQRIGMWRLPIHKEHSEKLLYIRRITTLISK